MILPHLKIQRAQGNFTPNRDACSGEIVNVPYTAVMRYQCLEIHGKAIKDSIINGKFSESFSIQDGVTEIQALIDCICVQWIEVKGKEEMWVVKGIDTVSGIYIYNIYKSFYSIS